MRTTGVVFILASVVLLGMLVIKSIQADFYFERDYGSQWQLADRASTIKAKRDKLTEFVWRLRHSDEFSDHNAVFLDTDANSFDRNVEVLDTLVKRLDEIQTMPVDSFQYNTAIQQITAQEQGEAHAMMNVFDGCYRLHNYPLAWSWILAWSIVVALVMLTIGVLVILTDMYNSY